MYTLMVVAHFDLNKNCKHGNPYACEQLNGDPGTVNGPNSDLTLPGLGSSGINVDRK
jgi:hypothetical protein